MYFAIGGRARIGPLPRDLPGGKVDRRASRPTRRISRPRDLRQTLEALHRTARPRRVARPRHPGPGPVVRYAARIAVEWQDPSRWRQKALTETDPHKAIAALVALSRVSGRDKSHRKASDPGPPIPPCKARSWTPWTRSTRRAWAAPNRADLLRRCRAGVHTPGTAGRAGLRPVDREVRSRFPLAGRGGRPAALAEILAYLQAPTAAAKLMAALREAPTQEEQIPLRPRLSAD